MNWEKLDKDMNVILEEAKGVRVIMAQPPMSAPISSRSKDETTGFGWYELNGKKYVRVTTVLEHFVHTKLKNYFINTGPAKQEKRKEETAGQGTEIHKKAHEGTEDRLNDLMKKEGMVKIASEIVLVSKNGWAGQADGVVEWKGKKYIMDWKTGHFSNVALQLGGYSLAANEMGMDIQGIGAVSLPRDLDRPAKYYDYTDYPGYPTMEDNQFAWAEAFDVWKRNYWNELGDWEFKNGKAVLSYNWSYGGPQS
jgi:hypothetical protein